MKDDNFPASASGTEQQQAAYVALGTLNMFAVLAPFDPPLTGSIALGLRISEPRLQVHCHAQDLAAFALVIRETYGGYPRFVLRHRGRQGLLTLTGSFTAAGFRFDVFAQVRPTAEQTAYRYIAAAATFLSRAGPNARPRVRALQEEGLTAEEALAEYFSLPGNPRLFLLALAQRPGFEADGVIARAEERRRSCRYCQFVADAAAPGRAYADPYAVVMLDPRATDWRRVLLLPRRHAWYLEHFPSHIQEDPLQAQALDPRYDLQVWRIWWKLSEIVRAAFPGLATQGGGWDRFIAAMSRGDVPRLGMGGRRDTAAKLEQFVGLYGSDVHAHIHQLVFPHGDSPARHLSSPPNWCVEVFARAAADLPVDEQLDIAQRLRAAIAATGLPAVADLPWLRRRTRRRAQRRARLNAQTAPRRSPP